jgi:HlyD family secretion protein
MQRLVTFKIVSLLCAAMMLAACAPGSGGKATPTPLPPVVSYEKSLFTVTQGPIVQESRLIGEIVPAKQEELFFRSSGFISRVAVKQGDVVEQGTVLAELQIDDMVNQLQQARIDLEVAQANLAKETAQRAFNIEKSKADVIIQQKLVELATMNFERAFGEDRQRAQIQLDIAIQNYRLAEASAKLVEEDTNPYMEQAVKRSQLSVERLEGMIAERQIVAPFDCVILRSSLRPGQSVEAFFVVFQVGEPTDLIVRTQYNWELAPDLTEDNEATLFLNSGDTEGYPVNYLQNFLPVSSNSVTGQSTSGDFFYFTLPDTLPREQIRVGQSVFVSVILGRKDKVLMLPPAAIREYRGLMFVIVQDGDVRRRVEINEVGLKAADRWEIIADLSEGDQVLGP